MPKPENINSRNIKYLEVANHNGDIETFFKASNKWYKVSHIQGSILDIEKVGFKYVDKEIAWIREPGLHFRIFEPSETKKYHNMGVPPGIDHVFYDTKIGNPHFWYGEDEIEVTARQIVRNYTKLKRKIQY